MIDKEPADKGALVLFKAAAIIDCSRLRQKYLVADIEIDAVARMSSPREVSSNFAKSGEWMVPAGKDKVLVKSLELFLVKMRVPQQRLEQVQGASNLERVVTCLSSCFRKRDNEIVRSWIRKRIRIFFQKRRHDHHKMPARLGDHICRALR